MTPDAQSEPNLYETDIFLTYLQRLPPGRAESMSTKKRILIVEDEPEIANLIRMHMDRNGFAADMVHSGKAGIVEIEQNMPDCVLLDLMLPDLDGLEVCRRLRRAPKTENLPIIIVSAKGEEADVVAGIELGADDYIAKPFSPRVLVARVKSVLRRTSPAESQEKANGVITLANELEIDTERHRVSVRGEPLSLTITEFSILKYLAARPGFVRTRDQIIASVHGGNTILSSRTVDVHVTALRRKLEGAGRIIETVRGVGYRLSENPDGA